MSIDITAVRRLAADFVAEVNAAFGLYLDATAGFTALTEKVQSGQRRGESTDESPFFYGFGVPGSPNNVLLHQTTQGILKQRIQEGGRNRFLLARLVLVLLYELWEAGYRTPLADAAAIPRDTLLVAVFGDLRQLRNAILHEKGRISPDAAAKLEVLPRPTTGAVDYDRYQVAEAIHRIKAAIDELLVRWTGEDPAYRTVWRVV